MSMVLCNFIKWGIMSKMGESKGVDRPQQRVAAWVRAALASGQLQPGDQLPSLQDLARLLRVNPLTARRALVRLEDDGLLEVRARVGTFVRPRAHMEPQKRLFFTLACPQWMTRLDRQHPLLLAWLEGLDAASRGRGVQISPRFFADDHFVSNVSRWTQMGECDGLIALSWWQHHDQFEANLRDCSIPTMVFHPQSLPLTNVATFSLDLMRAMHLAVADLVERGANRIGGIWYYGEPTLNRLLDNAWQDALRAAGLAYEGTYRWLVKDPADSASWDVVSKAIDAKLDGYVLWDEFIVDKTLEINPSVSSIALQDLNRENRHNAPASYFGRNDHHNLMGSVLRQLENAAYGTGHLSDIVLPPPISPYGGSCSTKPSHERTSPHLY